MNAEFALPIVIAVFTGPALGVLANYLLGRRKARLEERQNSGTITTTEAVDLWKESNAVRDAWRTQAETNLARAERAEEQIRKNNSQLINLNQKLSDVMDEFIKFRHNASRDSDLMQRKIDELKGIIKKLQAQNQRLLTMKGNKS